MDQNQLNKIRRMAGLPDSYKADERRYLEEKAAKKRENLTEAANHRAPANKIAEIARQHLHVRTLDKSGDDSKDYHDIPVWAIEKALKAAYKAGVDSMRSKTVKESADNSTEQTKKAAHYKPYDPKGGAPKYKDGEDKVEREESEEHGKRKGLAKGKAGTGYKTPKNKSAKQVSERHDMRDRDMMDMDMDMDMDDEMRDHDMMDMHDEMRDRDDMDMEDDLDDKDKECCPCPDDEMDMDDEMRDRDEMDMEDDVDMEDEMGDRERMRFESKKADKDYDKDGKLETPEKEYKGSRDKAIKKAKKEKMEEKSDRLDHLLRQEKKLKMQLLGARNSTEEADIEYNLDHVRSEIAKAKGGYRAEDNENCAMEGKSDNYNPPKGTQMKADSSSGAAKKVPNAYDKKPHKSDSHDAESRDKGRKLKKIPEGETKLSKDYRNQATGEVYSKKDYGKQHKNAYTTVVHKDDNIPGSNETVEKREGSGAKDKGEMPNAYEKPPHHNASINYGYEEVKKNARAGLKKIREYYDVDYKGKFEGGIIIEAESEEEAMTKAQKKIPEGCEATRAHKAPLKESETVFGKDYNDDGRVDRDESPDQVATMDPNNEVKVKVPPKYKTRMESTISELRKEADRVRVRDPYGADFYDNTATVFESLLEHLKEGTRRSLLLAQIDLNRIMSPMIQRLPNEVYMFIVRGGKPAALTELFKEVKVKKTGADLSKEKFTD